MEDSLAENTEVSIAVVTFELFHRWRVGDVRRMCRIEEFKINNQTNKS